MSATFQKLRAKLAELFQLDAAGELDFGIYRILNARRTEVERFLDQLQGEVAEIIAALLTGKSNAAHAEAAQLNIQLVAAGIAPDSSPRYLTLREEAVRAGASTTELENEIFSQLATFFSRYYKDGDFLSLRRYKRDTYAIPYEGEEVKLHWANADQFYIKSAENFRDYTFRLGPAPRDGAPDSRPTVTFKLTEADTERDNNKAVAGKERRFLHTGIVAQTAEALVLGFEYRALGEADAASVPDADAPADGKKPKPKDQATLNREAVQKILATCVRGPFAEIAALRPTEKNKQRSLLEKHLTDYTARNTFDYFIHKDLGGFLRRELDFFIKSEVLHLDDIEHATAEGWRQQQARLRAIRAIAHRVIRFLAQIEDFQKKLWLKKKFVTRCDWLITLDRLPAALLPEVAASAAQREEWACLLALDEIAADLGRTGYSEPLTVAFLKENLSLPLDTRHFGEEFRRKVMAGIEDEGATLGGTLIHSDNSQALALIRAAMIERIGVAYIDPPYNTGNDSFLYRDGFQHSSWISMIQQALALVPALLKPQAPLCCSIDDNEVHHLRTVLGQRFGESGFIANIVWQKRYAPDVRTAISDAHEHVLVFGRSPEAFKANRKKLPLTDFQRKQFKNSDGDERGEWKSDNFTAQGFRPNQMYEITLPSGRKVTPPAGRCWVVTAANFERLKTEKKMYFGVDGDGLPAVKRFLKDMDGMVPWTWWNHEEAGHSQAGLKETIDLFGREGSFITAKPTKLISRLVHIGSDLDSTVLDFFSGSGTTGHAVINLNREDHGTRKYVLVEMGEHFDTVLVPRLKKVIYAKDWKEGKPQSRNTGVSHACKVLRLESYEDTLNNLRLPARRTAEQELALAENATAHDEYTLGYMLELETQGSPSLLNVSAFTAPFSYTLQTATGTAGETRPVAVDLVETFNWLLGLTVRRTDFLREVCVVDGTNPQGERVLILWRDTAKVDAAALNKWFTKQGYSTRDLEYALLYVNGEHQLENLRREDQTWKVRLIDEEFPRLMWEGCE